MAGACYCRALYLWRWCAIGFVPFGNFFNSCIMGHLYITAEMTLENGSLKVLNEIVLSQLYYYSCPN